MIDNTGYITDSEIRAQLACARIAGHQEVIELLCRALGTRDKGARLRAEEICYAHRRANREEEA